MLRLVRPPCCIGQRSSLLRTTDKVRASLRLMSTRQAERLRRSPAATAAAAAEAKKQGEAAASAQAKSKKYTKLLSGASTRSPPPKKTTATSTTTNTNTSSAGASKPAMRGRFNRLVLERGFFFTVYHYVLGESLTLALAYGLHSHLLGLGDIGSWLAAGGFPTDRFLNVGPTIYGLQFSPRLVLNYLVANVCAYPLLPMQMRFCAATAPILKLPFTFVQKALRKTETAVPKAPSAQL